MNVSESVIVGSRLFADSEAIVFERQRLTYADIEQLSSRAARLLQEVGVQRGDRVAIMLPNVPAFVIWYYAILRLGAIAVSISTRIAPREVAFILDDCQARMLIATGEAPAATSPALPACTERHLRVSDCGYRWDGHPLSDLAELEGLTWVDMQPDDPAVILYTSGTTGFPKGATLSHRNVRATVHAFNHLCEMRASDRMLLAVPLSHCYGQNALLNAALNVGATLIMQRRFDLNESKQLIAAEKVTRLFGVPTTFQLLVDFCEPADLESVHYCFSAAATLPIQLSHRWREKFGMPIYEGYGLTETSPFASYNHRACYVPGSIGTPVDLVEMKVVDPQTGRTCRVGELGELVIRGPNVMLGYWNRSAETAEAVRDGWFHSGDIGRIDERGFFYIVDRLKDMISIGGMKVFPAEVERVLLDHPAVFEAAVVGRSEPVLGEQVVAFVVPAESSVSAEEILHHCRENLGTFKTPKQIVLIDQLPRNPTGKILKKELRQLDLASLHTQPASGMPAAEVDQATSPVGSNSHTRAMACHASDNRPDSTAPLVQRLQRVHPASRNRAIVALLQEEVQTLVNQTDPPGPDTKLVESGLDSLMIVQLRDRLQMHVGSHLELAATLVFDHPCIADLATYLEESLPWEVSAADKGSPEASGHALPGTSSGDAAPSVSAKARCPDPEAACRRAEIESMTEQQAMQALLRELSE